MQAPSPRTNPEADPNPTRPRSKPSALRLLSLILGLSLALSLLFVALVGGRGMRKHVFEASIPTTAAPASLLAAIVDPEAVKAIAGDVPGFGRLTAIRWDGAPRLGARVVETYERGSQSYVLTDFDPPWVLEERYELKDDPRFAVVEQRWQIREGEPRRLELRNVLYPRNLLGGFALELASGQEAPSVPLVKKLEQIEQWAREHPVLSTTVALSKVAIEQ